MAQGRVLLFNYWVCYCILKARKPRFQPLEAPGDAAPAPTADSSLSAEAPAFVPGARRVTLLHGRLLRQRSAHKYKAL